MTEHWKIGDITITKVVELEVLAGPELIKDATIEDIRAIEWIAPYVTDDDQLKVSIHALLVQTPTMRLVVDTCVGKDKTRSSAEFSAISDNFLVQLAANGWSRESVDAVICTHLHVDHVGWNTMLQNGAWVPTFPNARYYVGRREYAHWLSELQYADADFAGRPGIHGGMNVAEVWRDSVLPIHEAGLFDLVDDDAVIGAGVSLVPTPGHTPGHVSVRLESEGHLGFITGDIMHHPCQVAYPEWPFAFDTDDELGVETRRAFLRGALEQNALVIGTHFTSPSAARISEREGRYRFI